MRPEKYLQNVSRYWNLFGLPCPPLGLPRRGISPFNFPVEPFHAPARCSSSPTNRNRFFGINYGALIVLTEINHDKSGEVVSA